MLCVWCIIFVHGIITLAERWYCKQFVVRSIGK